MVFLVQQFNPTQSSWEIWQFGNGIAEMPGMYKVKFYVLVGYRTSKAPLSISLNTSKKFRRINIFSKKLGMSNILHDLDQRMHVVQSAQSQLHKEHE
jgi:hypothetical protein